MEPTVDQAHFPVMGTDAHVIVVDAPEDTCALIERRLRELEQHWSRFIETSELMKLNARPGVPVIVSPDTFAAIEMAVRAWEFTGGVFDPTVYDAMLAAGYDRDFMMLSGTRVPVPDHTERAPGCADIHLDATLHAITLPPGVHLDLGGIGKGLAADLIVREALGHGAAGACVNLGGDLCALGQPPNAAGWLVELTLPHEDALGGPTAITIPEGAVATSSTQKRRWEREDGETHHLIDPATGRAAQTGIDTVTVLALDAWWAETCAKAIIISGSLEWATTHGNAGLVVRADGSVEPFGGFEAYLVSPDPH